MRVGFAPHLGQLFLKLRTVERFNFGIHAQHAGNGLLKPRIVLYQIDCHDSPFCLISSKGLAVCRSAREALLRFGLQSDKLRPVRFPFGAYELYKAHLDDRMLENERNQG